MDKAKVGKHGGRGGGDGWGGVEGVKWRQLYVNNNKKCTKQKRKDIFASSPLVTQQIQITNQGNLLLNV